MLKSQSLIEPTSKVVLDEDVFATMNEVYSRYKDEDFVEKVIQEQWEIRRLPDRSYAVMNSITNGLFLGELVKPKIYATKAMAFMFTLENCRRVITTSEEFDLTRFALRGKSMEHCLISRPLQSVTFVAQGVLRQGVKEEAYKTIMQACEKQREVSPSDFPPLALTCEVESINGNQFVTAEGQNIFVEQGHYGKYGKGLIVNADFSLTPTFVTKASSKGMSSWAYGKTLKEAVRMATLYSRRPHLSFADAIAPFLPLLKGGLEEQLPVRMLTEAFVFLGGVSHKRVLQILEEKDVWLGGFLSVGKFLDIVGEAGDAKIVNTIQTIRYLYGKK